MEGCVCVCVCVTCADLNVYLLLSGEGASTEKGLIEN